MCYSGCKYQKANGECRLHAPTENDCEVGQSDSSYYDPAGRLVIDEDPRNEREEHEDR